MGFAAESDRQLLASFILSRSLDAQIIRHIHRDKVSRRISFPLRYVPLLALYEGKGGMSAPSSRYY